MQRLMQLWQLPVLSSLYYYILTTWKEKMKEPKFFVHAIKVITFRDKLWGKSKSQIQYMVIFKPSKTSTGYIVKMFFNICFFTSGLFIRLLVQHVLQPIRKKYFCFLLGNWYWAFGSEGHQCMQQKCCV